MDQDSDYCSNDSEENLKNSPTLQQGQGEQVIKQECIAKLIKLEKRSITFLVGKSEERVDVEEKELKLICKASTVLTKLIAASKFIEKGHADIKVVWSQAQTFRTFISFLQNDNEVKAEEVKDYASMIELCTRYKLSKLLGPVCSLAKQNITLDNCVELYDVGAIFDLEDVRIAAFNYFLKTGNAFVEHKTFLELDCVTLSILTHSDDFAVVELTLFKRLKDWVVEQCKRLGYPPDRKEFFGRVAGLLFRHVRYAQMTQKEFKTEVIPSGLLNAKDIEGINLRHKTHPTLWHSLATHPFVDRPRLVRLQFAVPLYNNVQIGFRKIAGASSTIQESVRFMVSHDIYLTSIGFFGPAKSDHGGNSAYSIRIHVEGDYSKYYCRCPPQNASVLTKENYTVDLSNPFHIHKLEPYKLTVWIDGEATQFGVFPLPQAVVLMQDKGELITFHFSDADADPQPRLEISGGPTSSPPFPNHNQFPTRQPRMSGVIRCISFVVRD